jgi:hypothetical protein
MHLRIRVEVDSPLIRESDYYANKARHRGGWDTGPLNTAGGRVPEVQIRRSSCLAQGIPSVWRQTCQNLCNDTVTSASDEQVESLAK